MTGRPARGFINRVMREIGPISDVAPAFPLAGGALAPLRAKAEAQGSGDFSPMWAGEAAALGRVLPAAELTRAWRRTRSRATRLGGGRGVSQELRLGCGRIAARRTARPESDGLSAPRSFLHVVDRELHHRRAASRRSP